MRVGERADAVPLGHGAQQHLLDHILGQSDVVAEHQCESEQGAGRLLRICLEVHRTPSPGRAGRIPSTFEPNNLLSRSSDQHSWIPSPRAGGGRWQHAFDMYHEVGLTAGVKIRPPAAPVLATAAMLSVQLGSALSTQLFSALTPAGTVWLSGPTCCRSWVWPLW